MAMTGSSTLMAADADLPFLSVFKDGELVESMCLHGLDSIVLGRHTNCDLMVTHPSVSRHHLEIQILHGSRELLLTDLDSIHGTWINGKQALPLVSATAKEGDTIKLGASSRTYSVQWRPHPPQNSTSSEDYSDKSNSPRDCTYLKENGAAESRTTMESSNPLQTNCGNILQPACCTKSTDFCAENQHKDEESALPEDELQADSLDSDKDACTTKDKKGLDCEDSQDNIKALENIITMQEEEFKIATESLVNSENACIGKERPVLDCEKSQIKLNCPQECIEANNSWVCLQTSMEEDEKVTPKVKDGVQSATDQSCFDGDDNGGENVDFQVEDHPIMPESKEESPASSKSCLDGSDGGENLEILEAKHISTHESEEANPAFSNLWLRRSRLNPPPQLLTSTSACSLVLLPLQEKNKSYLLPSAPPMPLSFLVNNVVPSAPPLPPPGKFMTISNEEMYRTIDDEPISDDFECDDSKENHHPSALSRRERSGEMAPISLLKPAEVAEDYVSDKENDSPLFAHACKHPKKKAQEGVSHERSYSATTESSRRPFQPLVLTADGGCRYLSPSFKNISGENSVTQMKRPSPVVQNLDMMLRKLKGMARSEPRRAWHIVVDISCFLDSSSFKSLRQLEGIREVRLIIPKIVISELDYRRGIGSSRRRALKWIESCMVKLPSWIHVQSSSEHLPVAVTPPVSPLSASSNYGGSLASMMSPMNGDHVLNCALLFSTTVFSGQVALVTNDIALKIKAMAEGLVCESPSTFCDSLLSPYSGRFLWASSIAHGHNWTEKPPCHMKSSSALAPSTLCAEQSTKEAVVATVKAMASRRNHAVESLKKQCCKQAQGLKVALS